MTSSASTGVSNDDDDPVVFEYDVILSNDTTSIGGTNVYQVQYPLRTNGLPLNPPPQTARFKNKVQLLEMKFALNSSSSSYSKPKGEQIATNVRNAAKKADQQEKSVFGNLMDHQTLVGTNNLGLSPTSYVFGIVKDDALYVTPMNGCFQMRPNFTYLDANESKANESKSDDLAGLVDSATDSESEATTSTKTIRIKFAREETERSRKRREASSQHRHRVAELDPWIPLTLASTANTSDRRLLHICRKRQTLQSPTSFPTISRVLRSSIPLPIEQNQKEADISADMAPMKRLRDLSLEGQVAALVAKANVIRFSTLLDHLQSNVKAADIAGMLHKCACLVHGCWVLRSDILYPKDTVSPQSGTSCECLCRARDFALYHFHRRLPITRRFICDSLRISDEDVQYVLNAIAECSTNDRQWHLRVPPDMNFAKKYPVISGQQEILWQKKWTDMQQFLIDVRKQFAQRKRRNSAPRRRRTTSIK